MYETFEPPFVDDLHAYIRPYVGLKDGLTQTFHVHLEEYGPGASHKGGHVKEAAFCILGGRAYESHDGVRDNREAGHGAIVHANCVH